MNKNKIITSLYDQYKNTNKKLKIICDWDEVIQAHEPYALWLAKREVRANPTSIYPAPLNSFPEYFDKFWGNNTTINNPSRAEYSSYGSRLSEWQITIAKSDYGDEVIQRQTRIKNDSNFYQLAPFLTIAEDLLKLIKEDKVEQLIFLVYCEVLDVKGKVEEKVIRDERIESVFKETFGKFPNCSLRKISYVKEKEGSGVEIQWEKTEWIKENASDFDIVIDDNPNICKDVLNNNHDKVKTSEEYPNEYFTVLAPYYPATENQHDKRVLLVKQEVSDLTKENFQTYGTTS